MRKKLLSIIALIAIITTMNSCKRNWVCECKNATTVVPIDITNTNKDDATKICDGYNYGLYSKTGGCSIK